MNPEEQCWDHIQGCVAHCWDEPRFAVMAPADEMLLWWLHLFLAWKPCEQSDSLISSLAVWQQGETI